MPSTRAILIWAALGLAIAVPVGIAARSPLLAWRDPIYIAAGLAGVIAMAFMLLQPLLVGGYLPGLRSPRGRRLHRWVGLTLLCAVVIHVGGLWLTSPPDVIDALLFVSPTPFSDWGVIGMWALLIAALLALFRRRWRLRPGVWRYGHAGLTGVAVASSIAHALLIEGTMGTVSKVLLCALVAIATVRLFRDVLPSRRKG